MEIGADGGAPGVVFDRGGWWVLMNSEGRTQEFRCTSEDQARRWAETLARQKPRATAARSVRATSRSTTALPTVEVLKKS